MNKDILNVAFTKDEIFKYKCPCCYAGTLHLDGDFRSEETEASKSEHHEDWWEPEMIGLVFNMSLKCANCREIVFVVGRGSVEQDVFMDDRGEWCRNYVEYFTPTYFYPPLQLIDYPARAPQEILGPLSKASELFFSSPAACCNNVRAAAELMLGHIGVPEKNGNSRISFGNRIKMLGEDNKDVRELFGALKVLGNHGSHPGSEIVVDDAIHALEISEYMLEKIYGDRRETVHKLAKAINDRQSPLGRLYKWILNKQ